MTNSASINGAATGEFELIDAIVKTLGAASTGSHVLLGPGDDAAMIALPAGDALVTSVDTLLPDVHFPEGAAAPLIGQRALRVSVSDLAAMGAQPLACVISLVLPKSTHPQWVRDLSRGFADAALEFGCPVTGGNLTAGPLSICVTVQGSVPAEFALTRDGAQPGDDVWVSGPLGGAAVALIEGELDRVPGLVADAAMSQTQQQYFLPTPQLTLGVGLRLVATSAIDISDGLAADLGHIVHRSEVAIALDGAAIPRFAGATLEQALYGGDDYHLCFTAPKSQRDVVNQLGDGLRRIGYVSAGAPKLLLDGAVLPQRGFDHFASEKN